MGFFWPHGADCLPRFGRDHAEPRLTCYFGASLQLFIYCPFMTDSLELSFGVVGGTADVCNIEDKAYTYSGRTIEPLLWSRAPVLQDFCISMLSIIMRGKNRFRRSNAAVVVIGHSERSGKHHRWDQDLLSLRSCSAAMPDL